jgi:hypothetical protein
MRYSLVKNDLDTFLESQMTELTLTVRSKSPSASSTTRIEVPHIADNTVELARRLMSERFVTSNPTSPTRKTYFNSDINVQNHRHRPLCEHARPSFPLQQV